MTSFPDYHTSKIIDLMPRSSKHAPRYASQILSTGFDQVITVPHASKAIHYFDTVHKFFQSCIDKDATDEVENSAHWNRVRNQVLANVYDV